MRGKISLILGLFLLVILVNINSASALIYDCEYRQISTCAAAGFPNIVFKTSSLTNAHGEIFNGAGSYGYAVCCNFPGNRVCLPDQTNIAVTLSGNTNAHAEIKSQSNYNVDICYNQSLKCVNTASCDNTYPIDLISLSSITNSHISDYSDSNYAIKICCQNVDEPVILTCDPPNVICGVNDICINPVSGLPGCCGSCCTPLTTQQACNGIACGSVSDGCGGTITCTDTCVAPNVCQGNSCVCVPLNPVTACTNQYGAGYQCGFANDGCGSQVACGTCPPAGSPNEDQCNTVTGQCYEPPPAPCSFTSVYWNKATAVGGDPVQLIVQGSNCNGLSVSFEIWEDDGILGDNTLVSLGGTNPTSATMSGGVVVKAWNAQYFEDTDGSNPEDEYYFKATIAGIGTEESGLGGGIRTLTVSAPVIPPVDQCTGILTCADYNATTCEADTCNVACTSIGGCGGSCPGPDYKDNAQCFWNASAGPSGTCGVGFNVVTCPVTQCGNGIQEIGEACDGNSFEKPDGSGNFTCQDYGFSGGSLTCTSCNISTVSCTGYNCVVNGNVEFRNESCDPLPPPSGNLTRFDNNTGEIIGLWSCIDLGYTGGQLSCDDSCNFAGCTIDSSGGIVLGNCDYNTGNVIDCNDPLSNGLYEASWTGAWDWGANNYTTNATCEATHGVGKCILDEGGYHYYPMGSTDWQNCEAGGQNTIECPAQIRLPFFGNLQFIITLLVIALMYGLIALDRKK